MKKFCLAALVFSSEIHDLRVSMSCDLTSPSTFPCSCYLLSYVDNMIRRPFRCTPICPLKYPWKPSRIGLDGSKYQNYCLVLWLFSLLELWLPSALHVHVGNSHQSNENQCSANSNLPWHLMIDDSIRKGVPADCAICMPIISCVVTFR